MDDHRARPRFQAGETETLHDFLARHRDTLRLKNAGRGVGRGRLGRGRRLGLELGRR